ncbi:MAG: glycerol-3-phosphate responsive antiterminator [Bacillota bacterium]
MKKDKEGIKYLAREIKPDGIITTKSNLIKVAKKGRANCNSTSIFA